MAYKFQFGNARLSGTVFQEGSLEVYNDAGDRHVKLKDDGEVSGSGEIAGKELKIGNF